MHNSTKSAKFQDDKKLPFFRFGLRGSECTAVAFLEDYPMTARTINIKASQVAAVNAILSNATDGEVAIRYFKDLKASEYGFSYTIFKSVLKHIHNVGWINWKDNGTSKSTITYSRKVLMPGKLRYHPPMPIVANIKNQKGQKRRVKLILNTKFKKSLDKRIRRYWDFVRQHEIAHNISQEQFDIVAEYYKEMKDKKKTPSFPDNSMIFPVAVFNNKRASIGGRFYGAFWIGMPSILRRLITIDGELTADIDGCAMHVQLLYHKAKVPVPDCELYIYTDNRRDITKKLMLYMMNTRKNWPGDSGRIAVIKTYKRHHAVHEDLMPYIIELEELHKPIKHFLYKSNWGELQGTEAGIMLSIMETAMKEDILLLPVHDGCLCQQKHRDRVLEFFSNLNIEAEENKKHLQAIDWDRMKPIYDAKLEVLEAERRVGIMVEKHKKEADEKQEATSPKKVRRPNRASRFCVA